MSASIKYTFRILNGDLVTITVRSASTLEVKCDISLMLSRVYSPY